MKGIQFVLDDKGDHTAVIIDLKKHGDLWEDFYDSLTANQKRDIGYCQKETHPKGQIAWVTTRSPLHVQQEKSLRT